MKEWIQLADGTAVLNSYVVGMGERIAIYGRDEYSFQQLYAMFGDAEKTKVIESEQYGDSARWEGYTIPYSIQTHDNGFTVCLRKQTNEP